MGASIYLFPRSAKLVVCDIDGTITRSDVFGQILPVMGYGRRTAERSGREEDE